MKHKVSLLLLILTFCGVVIIYFISTLPRVNITSDFVLSDYKGEGIYYSIEETNMMICDLTTVSIIINRMLEDGYSLRDIERTDKLIDVILSKDDLKIRIHYTNDGTFTSVAVPYQKSFVPLTYISEK